MRRRYPPRAAQRPLRAVFLFSFCVVLLFGCYRVCRQFARKQGGRQPFFQFFLNIFWDTDFTDEHVLTSSFTISYGFLAARGARHLSHFLGFLRIFQRPGAKKARPSRNQSGAPACSRLCAVGGPKPTTSRRSTAFGKSSWSAKNWTYCTACTARALTAEGEESPGQGNGDKEMFPALVRLPQFPCSDSFVAPRGSAPPGGGWSRAKPAGGCQRSHWAREQILCGWAAWRPGVGFRLNRCNYDKFRRGAEAWGDANWREASAGTGS